MTMESHHIFFPKNHRRLIDKFCGFCIGLPLFVELTREGFNLPQDHYSMMGISLHSSMVALLFLLPSFRFNRSNLLVILIFLVYLVICLFQDFSRALFALQSVYFFTFYFTLQSLHPHRLRVISLSALSALILFVVAHLVSIIFNSFFGMGEGYAWFWGLQIYQAFLTYTIVLIFALWISGFIMQGRPRYILFFTLVVLILEMLLFRKAALGVLMFYLIIYYPKIMFVLTFPTIVAAIIFIYNFPALIQSRLSFSRGNAWLDAVGLLSNDFIVLFGNGLNNYAHNLYLQILTTHGLIYSVFYFSLLLLVVISFIRNTPLVSSLFLIVIILIDWTVNANLLQPYYAGVLALTLLTIKQNYSSSRSGVAYSAVIR